MSENNHRSIGIILSGDADKDREELERATTYFNRTDQGLCPNGCGELNWSDDGFLGDCPDCQFRLSTNSPYGKRDEDFIEV